MSHAHDHPEPHIPLGRFAIAMIAQFAAMVLIYRWAFPASFQADIAEPWRVAMWVIILGIPLSLFEYLYHRYLLHSAVLPFLGAMHDAHSTHHGLTAVKAPVTPKDPERMVTVDSDYPVEEEHQHDSMMFPMWSLPLFMIVFLGLLGAPFKALFPTQPIILALLISVTFYYCFYEVWHAILHLPYERFWKPLIDGRWTRATFKRMYSFHLMHHWRPTSNLAVVGFWGIALWDHVFRTHRRPERLPVDGGSVNYHDAQLHKPIWPISAIDRHQPKLYKTSRAIEQWLGRVFLRRRKEA